MFTLKNILANKGATIDKNGNPVNYPRGYQVSVCDMLIIKARDLRKKTLKALLATIGADACLGIWIDKGFVYIDQSIMVRTKKQAIKLGKQYNQISIWNWKQEEAVYL